MDALGVDATGRIDAAGPVAVPSKAGPGFGTSLSDGGPANGSYQYYYGPSGAGPGPAIP
jgi:hypothetical protein